MGGQMNISDARSVAVIGNRGCSRLFSGRSFSFPQTLRILQSLEPVSPASSSMKSVQSSELNGPFSGLVICVTGLSKEARNQVMEATMKLGGQYSPDLHPQCTHLVAQSFGGRKFDHAMKHGAKNGLFIVTLGWFVDSVRRKVRLSESLYNVKGVKGNGMKLDDFNRLVGSSGIEKSCIPVTMNDQKSVGQAKVLYDPSHDRNFKINNSSVFFGSIFYIDEEIPEGLKKKIHEAAAEEGATVLNQWFAGCKVSHVICEAATVFKYLGHCSNIVSPAWVMKSIKEKNIQRLIHISVDLGRQTGNFIENYHQNVFVEEDNTSGFKNSYKREANAGLEERQKIVDQAKKGVRNRRGRCIQTCQNPIRPLTPSSLLDSICWSVSEPASTASVYTDSVSGDNISECQTPVFSVSSADKCPEASFSHPTRPLTESEKREVVFRCHLLTILFPIDRFDEMGPSSRTYFSENGFTCMQILEHIYAFYQENMSSPEVELAIHTDSRYADRLRSVYASKETEELGHIMFKRMEFLGSRKSFEMLKRVTGDNSSNAYTLLLRA